MTIVLSVGIFQIGAGVLIMNLALQAVPAGRSSVLVYAMPLWVAVLMWLFFRTAPRDEMLGLVLGLTGVLVLVNPTVIDWGVPTELAGTLALIFNAILWAGTNTTTGATPGCRARWTSSRGCSWPRSSPWQLPR